MSSAYVLYLKTYARVASGVQLGEADFLNDEALPQPLDLIGLLAITLAAYDVTRGRAFSSITKFDKRVQCSVERSGEKPNKKC